MGSTVARRVVNVTPRTKGESIAHWTGVFIEVTGWLMIAVVAVSTVGLAFTILTALLLIWMGRKVRTR